MRIKSTAWAKRFKRDSPYDYDQAIAYAIQPRLRVYIDSTNILDNGTWLYFIGVEWTYFWLDAFPTREEAVKLCKKMGWEIINELD